MGEFSQDPKGYYAMLGISETAEISDIKTAFRNKAKRLHPDINPSPIAAKQFQRLSEAYEILSDTAKRAAYDSTADGKRDNNRSNSRSDNRAKKSTKQKTRETGANSRSETRSRTWQRSETRNTSYRSRAKTSKPQDAKPDSQTQSSTSETTAALKPEVCKCGKMTAQPRYIEFDMVAGRGRKVLHKTISGVFCRSCADRAALKASFVTWFAGWWAIPDGPKETIKALLTNIRGGRKPADRNTRLLIRQAMAFRDKGDVALARGTAEQALTFAGTPDLRREVDTLLLSLSAHGAKALKTRWDKPGWVGVLQLAPVIVFVMWLSYSVTVSAPTSLTRLVQDGLAFVSGESVTPAKVGDGMTVVPAALNMRTGPGRDYQVVEVLARGDTVIITEFGDKDWVRVAASSGASGFVPMSALESIEVTD